MRLKSSIQSHQIEDNEELEMIQNVIMTLMLMITIKYSTNGCTGQAVNPQYIAKNLLNREFTTDALNEKRLTDVTEFHYYIRIEKHKIYLQIA